MSEWADQGELTKGAILSLFKLIDPSRSKEAAKELVEIKEALATGGEWSKDEEWRISTWMTATIRPETRENGENWFRVTVECDGQLLSCGCPSIDRAFAFYRLYAHLIVYQFYSVGPPWMGRVAPNLDLRTLTA